MISYEEALAKVLEAAEPLGEETCPLEEALGRVLSTEVRTHEPVPRFAASAMDGYAVRAEDTDGASEDAPRVLPVQGEQRAGGGVPPALEPGKALRIYTGAMVPEAADAVVQVERTEEVEGGVRMKAPVKRGENIRLPGEEFPEGALLFTPGTRVTPSVAGTLASLGLLRVAVRERPRVSVVITGDEVRPPGEAPGPGQVRDANSFSLTAALACLGIRPWVVLHAGDDPAALEKAFTRAMEGAKVVLSSGGVSMGRYDLVRAVLSRMGVEECFWKVAMKPGKPNFFGRGKGVLFFGLPGNTVSVLVTFYMLVRPALFRMEGRGDPFAGRLRARLEGGLRKKAGRIEFVRGRLHRAEGGGWAVEPVPGRESHMLGNLARANGLIRFPEGMERLEAGAEVTVDPLQWSDL